MANRDTGHFFQSFGHAFRGWAMTFSTQPNAKIHALATVLVVLLAIWLQVTWLEWAILLLTIGFVWAAEMINTAIEAAVDISAPDFHPMAKVAKDTAAGAVLVAAFSAVAVGLLILGPPLCEKLTGLF